LLDLVPASAKKSADVTQLQIGVKVRDLWGYNRPQPVLSNAPF
jgi:hypothetical protein